MPKGASVITTHFGRIEDLRADNSTNTNNDQLGYTDAAVNLHTDQPFIQNPPGKENSEISEKIHENLKIYRNANVTLYSKSGSGR